MQPVPQYTVTWTARQDEHLPKASEKKTADGEWLHGTKHFSAIAPDNGVTEWTVDGWINTHRQSPFTKLAELKEQIRRTTFKPTSCLLDGVVPLFVKLPSGWDWHPAADHPVLPIVDDPSVPLLAAIPLLMAVRGEIQARERVGTTLNFDNVVVVPAKVSTPTKPLTLPLNWTVALKAGRRQVDNMLNHADEPDYAVKKPEHMNAHLLALMCKADDKGLGKLLEFGLIDPTGYQGNPFQAKAKGYALEVDNSGALLAAYNHLRFVLYMEFRALREMIYGW